MSSEAERITTTGERSPGGVPNLTPAQYMLASRPEMWPVAAALLDRHDTQEGAKARGLVLAMPWGLTDQERDALVACGLLRQLPGLLCHAGPFRAWCLAALAIQKAHNAGMRCNQERQRRHGEEIPGVHYNAD